MKDRAEPKRALRKAPPARHPAFGALKDITHLVPGVDLTEPAFPDWEEIWLDANAWWLDDPKLNPTS